MNLQMDGEGDILIMDAEDECVKEFLLHQKVFDSPIGRLLITADEEGICEIRLMNPDEEPEEEEKISFLPACAAQQLEEYFAGRRQRFELPLSRRGTAFEREVWQALEAIPFGETRSYGQLAAQLGKPNAARAVGGACARNPLLIIVPCHRVIASSGALTGFAAGMDAKRLLLELEGHRIK